MGEEEKNIFLYASHSHFKYTITEPLHLWLCDGAVGLHVLTGWMSRVRFLDEEMGSENIFFFPVSAPATTIGKKLLFLSLKLHTRPLSPVTPPAPTIGKRDEEKKYFFFFKLQHTH